MPRNGSILLLFPHEVRLTLIESLFYVEAIKSRRRSSEVNCIRAADRDSSSSIEDACSSLVNAYRLLCSIFFFLSLRVTSFRAISTLARTGSFLRQDLATSDLTVLGLPNFKEGPY